MNTTLLGIDLKRPSIIDIIILLIAVSIVTVSAALTSQLPNYNLFERSGSLVVLLAVIVEFRNSQLQQKLNDKAASLSGGIGGILAESKQLTFRQPIILTAHLFIISGTIIWGYGSILQQLFQQN